MLHKVSGKNRCEVCATFLLTKLGGMWYNENSGARERAPAVANPNKPFLLEEPLDRKRVYHLTVMAVGLTSTT